MVGKLSAESRLRFDCLIVRAKFPIHSLLFDCLIIQNTGNQSSLPIHAPPFWGSSRTGGEGGGGRRDGFDDDETLSGKHGGGGVVAAAFEKSRDVDAECGAGSEIEFDVFDAAGKFDVMDKMVLCFHASIVARAFYAVKRTRVLFNHFIRKALD